MKFRKLTLAAALAISLVPLSAYTAMAEEVPTAEQAIPEELVVQGEYDEYGNLCVGDLWFMGEDYTYEDGTYVDQLVVGGTSSITEAVIPSYVRFTDQETGEERTLPVTQIGNEPVGGEKALYWVSFNSCKNLKSVTIPDTVKMIGYYAFDGCTSLTSIRLPKSTDFMYGSLPFARCTNLASIEVDPENKTLYSKDGVLFSRKVDGTAKIIRYPIGKTDKAYVIPNNVTDVHNLMGSAFEDSSITTLYVPKITNEAIVSEGFYKCPNLTDIYFEGTEEEWNSVTHYNEDDTTVLKDVTVHFNAKPTDVDPDWTPEGNIVVNNFTDEETGISVTAVGDIFPEGVTFNVKMLDSTDESINFDITFTDAAGKEVQPNSTVSVSVPLPEDWRTAYAYRVEGGQKTRLQSVTKNGKIVFYTDHFSVYEISTEYDPDAIIDEPATNNPIISKPADSEPATSEPSESEPSESEPATSESSVITPGDTDGNSSENSGENSGNDQANTGIALAIAPAALACAAVIAASKKRK